MESTLKEKFVDILDECGGVEELKEALDEFLKHEVIKVGDIVRVTNWGRNYSSYNDWFIENDIPRELCIKYAYKQIMHRQHRYADSDTFKVLAVHDRKALIMPIGKYYDDSCYLVDINGLVKEW